MPGKLPAEIQVNMQVVNENNAIYPTEFDDMYLLAKMAFVLLLVYFAVYMIFTPGQCLTPGQWTKLWEAWLCCR